MRNEIKEHYKINGCSIEKGTLEEYLSADISILDKLKVHQKNKLLEIKED